MQIENAQSTGKELCALSTQSHCEPLFAAGDGDGVNKKMELNDWYRYMKGCEPHMHHKVKLSMCRHTRTDYLLTEDKLAVYDTVRLE